MLNKDSVIQLNFPIRADDALRTVTILGRSNGVVMGLQESLYNRLADALGIDTLPRKRELDNVIHKVVDVIDYNRIQKDVEDIFFNQGKIKLELDKKVRQLQELTSEIEKLQKQLGE